VNPETTPPQPDEVARAITELLDEVGPAPDPWWQAGIDESLDE
jgi:hypothetical protein